MNNGVLVPTYDVKQDQEAVNSLKKIFLGRTVIGVNVRSIIQQNGSRICITMHYPYAAKFDD